MNDFQIGRLIFTKKAVFLIAFRLFILGIAIGISITIKEEHVDWVLPVIFSGALLSLFTFKKATAENIIEINK